MISKVFRITILMELLSLLTSCIAINVKGAGVFKNPIEYDHKNLAHVEIGSDFKTVFRYLGDCGGSVFALGIIVPIPVPWYSMNRCEENGFSINRDSNSSLDFGVTYQLHYNGSTYDPYIDNGSVKFKIPNFSSFKSAPDKKLIIHKKKPDGTMWSKELPFDWKIVIE